MSESKRERQEFTFEIHERICVLGKGRDNGFKYRKVWIRVPPWTPKTFVADFMP